MLVAADVVYTAADVLVVAGEEPSMVVVQQRIGGGSYTTTNRYLDAWKQSRAAQLAVCMPAEIGGQSVIFVEWFL